MPLSDEEGLEWADVLQKPRLEFFPPSSLQKPPQAMKDAAIVVCNGNLGRLHSRQVLHSRHSAVGATHVILPLNALSQGIRS